MTVGIISKDIDDETFLDGLLHRIAVEESMLGSIPLGTGFAENLKRLVLRRSGEREIAGVGQHLSLLHNRIDLIFDGFIFIAIVRTGQGRIRCGGRFAVPYAYTEAMQLHLNEISRHVARGAHAVLLLDRAGWHTTTNLDVPVNITPIFLPSRARELNPVENFWQYLRANWLSNRVFETYDEIIAAACDAWQKLIAKPETITSIGIRQWAHVGQTQ